MSKRKKKGREGERKRRIEDVGIKRKNVNVC